MSVFLQKLTHFSNDPYIIQKRTPVLHNFDLNFFLKRHKHDERSASQSNPVKETVNRTLTSEIWARIPSRQPSVPERFPVRAPLTPNTIKITLLCESQLVYGDILVCGLPLSHPPPTHGLLNFPKCGAIKRQARLSLYKASRDECGRS